MASQGSCSLWVDDDPAVLTPYVTGDIGSVQIFRFVDGRIKSFEEYFGTAQLAAVYGG